MMTSMNPNETAKSWRAHQRQAAVGLYLTGAEGDAAALVGARVAGFPLALNLIGDSDRIDPEELASCAAAVVQVDRDNASSVKRFQKLASATKTPLIAAAYDPPLAFVRSLIHAGARDVLPLPLDMVDLETSLAPIAESLARREQNEAVRHAKVVSIIKSLGGVGATSMLGQLGIRFARQEVQFGREVCLIDLDVQFGDAAFQLGLQPKLTLSDLVDAGSRLDGDLVRSASTLHPSGLHVIAAPPEMMPLESLTSEQLLEIVEIAAREFGTVLIDLPSNWTNWSLSLLARSDLVLLVAQLSIPSLNRAKRQLELMRSQDLDNLDVRIVVNRLESRFVRTIHPSDVEQGLGHPVSYTIANDHAVMRAAIDRGVPIDEVKRKTALGKDLDTLDAGIAAALGLER
jgi:pilus assembly protein CpaE